VKYYVAILLFFTSVAALAGIEKIALPTDAGLKLMWWPKVAPPKGWHFDQGSSYNYSFNAMAPDGSTFSKAETVMYAKADYKPRLPDTTTLQAFVNDDEAYFKNETPKIIIVHEPTLYIGQKLRCQFLYYHPAAANPGNWEKVAYCEDGAYFLTFVVSSRTRAGLQAAIPAFRSMLSSYSVGP
jgi:hypothetical protein